MLFNQLYTNLKLKKLGVSSKNTKSATIDYKVWVWYYQQRNVGN